MGPHRLGEPVLQDRLGPDRVVHGFQDLPELEGAGDIPPGGVGGVRDQPQRGGPVPEPGQPGDVAAVAEAVEGNPPTPHLVEDLKEDGGLGAVGEFGEQSAVERGGTLAAGGVTLWRGGALGGVIAEGGGESHGGRGGGRRG